MTDQSSQHSSEQQFRIEHDTMGEVRVPIDEDHPSLLDLLPNEWEMLAMIDGQSDLRGIATRLGRSEFDVAKIAYGLLSTGIIQVRAPERMEPAEPLAGDDPLPHMASIITVIAATALTTFPVSFKGRWLNVREQRKRTAYEVLNGGFIAKSAEGGEGQLDEIQRKRQAQNTPRFLVKLT